MKIILPLIVLLIIIIFTIIILNNNIYFSEDFIGSYNQNTIEDLIPVSYIPFNPYLIKKSTAYEVIDIYKKVLNRSPEIEEIDVKIYLTKDELNEELYNSYEYNRLIKIQDNLAINDIEKTIAYNNLTKRIIYIYKDNYNKNPDDRFVSPLTDCYIHLRSNIFLFIVFIKSTNFIKFEKEILATKNLTKGIILEIFDKYFNLLELKLLAEDKIKTTRGDISLSIATNDINYDILRNELGKIINVASNVNTNNLSLYPSTSNFNIVTNERSNVYSNINSNVSSSNISFFPPISSNLLPTNFNISTNIRSNLDVNSLRNYFNTITSNIEPFTNKLNCLNTNSSITNVYDNTQVGNIFNQLKLEKQKS